MRRGDIHWFPFRAPDKRRPVLILTRSSLLQHLGTATVAAITSTRRGVPSEVALDAEDGLPRPCAANLHNVFTVRKAEIGPLVTSLSGARMAAVDRALVFALGVGEQAPGGSA